MKTKPNLTDTIIEAIAESENFTIQEASQEYIKRSEHAVDFNKLKPQDHHWVNRGLKWSCEGASHAHHEFWPRRAGLRTL